MEDMLLQWDAVSKWLIRILLECFLLILLSPANEVWGRVIFLHLFFILFTWGGVHGQGGMRGCGGACMPEGACMVGGVHGKGVCVARGACMAGEHAWPGGACHACSPGPIP